MKGRRKSSTVKLDLYAKIVFKTILQHQDPNTGLMSDNENGHAWIRDNVYSILSVWALSLAYKKYSDYDEDRAKSNELERACIKCMRGLLAVMTRQRHKIEQFKENPSPLNSVHAKFGYKTGLPVVGDSEWGHLQVSIPISNKYKALLLKTVVLKRKCSLVEGIPQKTYSLLHNFWS